MLDYNHTFASHRASKSDNSISSRQNLVAASSDQINPAVPS
jgi:hypothetical protein